MADALKMKVMACLDAWRYERMLRGKAGGPVLQPRARLRCPAERWCLGQRLEMQEDPWCRRNFLLE